MQTKKIFSLIAILVFIGLPMFMLATGTGGGPEQSVELPEVSTTDAITRIGNWAFYFLITLGAIFIVVAGIEFLTAGGNPDSVKRARDTLTYAVVGVALGLLAKGLVKLVETIIANKTY